MKTKGNEFMKAEKYDDALEMYSEAIEKDPSNYVLYSNRSAAYSKKEDFESALKDAEKTIELNSDWPKACLVSVCVWYSLVPMVAVIILVSPAHVWGWTCFLGKEVELTELAH